MGTETPGRRHGVCATTRGPRDHHGIDEVLSYFTHRRDLVQHTMRMHPRELLVGDDAHVAALTDGTATISGVEHSWPTIGLYRIDQDRIAEC